LGTLAHSIV